MGRLTHTLRRLAKLPGVPQARHVSERLVAPYLRDDLHSIHLGLLATVQRLEQEAADRRVAEADLRGAISDLEQHMPTVLNAIWSTNGTARLLRRELTDLSERTGETTAGLVTEAERTGERVANLADRAREAEARLADLAHRTSDALASRPTHEDLHSTERSLRSDLAPHIDTLAWLVERVEFVRAETMNEIRYGKSPEERINVVAFEPSVVNPESLTPSDGVLRINLGAGHIPLDGFANVDMRPLPGIDVVASVDNLPLEQASVEEIFSAHTLEHFPEEEMRRRLLPYWLGLLRPGGTIRAVVPDMEAMTKEYAQGKRTFENLRMVAYGGQEYEGDFHFTGYTPDSLIDMFTRAGFVDARVLDRARVNGACLECEVAATRPAS